DLAGARSLYERALAIREKVLGPSHVAVAQSFSDLAGLHRDEGDLTGARVYYERALAIFEATSPSHPNTNRVRCNLARLLLTAGSAAEALALAETALAGDEKVLGKDHPWTRDSAAKVAEALAKLGRADEALALRQRCGLEPDSRPTSMSRSY